MDNDLRNRTPSPSRVIEEYTELVKREAVLDFCVWLRNNHYVVAPDHTVEGPICNLTQLREDFLSGYIPRRESGEDE